MGRTILVGDVHGCADELGDLLDAVGYAQGVDALILVGDLVARGPDSRGAICRARDAGARAVRGNHDEKVLAFYRVAREKGRHAAEKCVHLGERHRKVAHELSDEEFSWLDALPLWLALAAHDLIVVHAGLVPGLAPDANEPHLMMNLRSIDADGTPTRKLQGVPWARAWSGPGHVVFGHDARRGLQLEARATGLDTGCCYGRALTALVLDANEPVPLDLAERRAHLVNVPARAVHCPMGDGSGPE